MAKTRKKNAPTKKAKALLDGFVKGFLSEPEPDPDAVESARDQVIAAPSIVHGRATLIETDDLTIHQRGVAAGLALDAAVNNLDSAEWTEAAVPVALDFLLRLAQMPEALTKGSLLHHHAAESLAVMVDRDVDGAEQYLASLPKPRKALQRLLELACEDSEAEKPKRRSRRG